MTTDQKGAIAESAVVHAAIKLGIGVFKPLTDGERYDVIFDLRPRLFRVQCKWAARTGDVIGVRCYSSRRRGASFQKRPYTCVEADAIVAFCADVDRCYVLPLSVFSGRSEVQLRLAPARNKQVAGIHWASQFELESLDWNEIRGP